jgi:hypothetical protein
VRTSEGLVQVDVASGQARRLTTVRGDSQPAWSPGGRLLAFERHESPRTFRSGVWSLRVGAGPARQLLGWADAGRPVWRR